MVYRLFAQLPAVGPKMPEPPLGATAEYIDLRMLLRGAAIAPQISDILKRWCLACLANGALEGPKVLAITVGGQLAHWSFILPRLRRISGMRSGDIEIGPCFTFPEFRRRRLFDYALRRILCDLWRRDRVMWMLVRSDNRASSAAIFGAGFTEVALCSRNAHPYLPMHAYAIIDRAGNRLAKSDVRKMRDLLVEQARYNARAIEAKADGLDRLLLVHGESAIRETLRAPFSVYHEIIRRHVKSGDIVVDLCAGDGLHSITAALAGAKVTVLDVAENSLRLACRRAKLNGVELIPLCSGAERLPFLDSSVDIVTCAGGLSYVDHAALFREIQRVLRAGGVFVFIDSFNHNPIYRLNRVVHWLRGKRTLSTLRRMPDERMIAELRDKFCNVTAQYYGAMIFLVPVLRLFAAEDRVAMWIKRLDKELPLHPKLAFRIVIVGYKQGVPANGGNINDRAGKTNDGRPSF